MLEERSWGEVLGFRMARSWMGRAFYFTAAYLVDGLLIDSGCAYTAEELDRALWDRPVVQVVNTHRHEDHIGGNGLLQRQRGVRILAPAGALPYLEDPRRLRLHPYRRVFWGWPEPAEAQPLGDEVLTDRHCFVVVQTPGHTPEHVSFYEPREGWLFSGDAFVGGRDRALMSDSDIHAIIASLKRILELDPRWLFPGSGKPRERPAGEVREKVRYLEDLRDRILALHEQGLSPRAIRQRVLGRETFLTWATLGHMSGLNLVQNCLQGAERGPAEQESWHNV